MTHAMDSCRALTDRELIRRMREPGSPAFRVLFQRHARAVHGYVRTRLIDDSHAEDIFQDIFITAWSKLNDRKMTGSSALPWLILTARNLVSNANEKARSRVALPLEDADVAGVDSSLAAAVDAEAASALSSAMAKLSDIDRSIVESCLVDGRLYKEVARDTGNSVGVIRNRLARVRRFLRGELTPLRGEDS